MGDVRRVYPRRALDATRSRNGAGWWLLMPGGLTDVGYSDAEFAAAFVPADLIDDIIAAAREVVQTNDVIGALDYEIARAHFVDAVRRYDEHTAN